jgi:hypothetical protein
MAKKKTQNTRPTLASLHARLSTVEARLLSVPAAEAETRPITFTMRSGNAPSIVQLILQDSNPGEPLVLTPNNPSRSSKPRAAGTTILIGISSQGNPGQFAVIDVSNVTPQSTPIVTSQIAGSSASDADTITTQF